MAIDASGANHLTTGLQDIIDAQAQLSKAYNITSQNIANQLTEDYQAQNVSFDKVVKKGEIGEKKESFQVSSRKNQSMGAPIAGKPGHHHSNVNRMQETANAIRITQQMAALNQLKVMSQKMTAEDIALISTR